MARTNVCIPYVFEFQSYVTGHHVYKDIWTPTLGEKLSTATEPENHHDKICGKEKEVLKEKEVVGHVPRDISNYCTSALLCGGTIKSKITGKRQNKRGDGLEVPYKYIVKGPFHMISNVKKIIKNYLSRTTK